MYFTGSHQTCFWCHLNSEAHFKFSYSLRISEKSTALLTKETVTLAGRAENGCDWPGEKGKRSVWASWGEGIKASSA